MDSENKKKSNVPVEKKKRGRKKKWEVETCQKLLEGGCSDDVISFPQNEKESTDLYDSTKSISFGNLNIVIHSKDTESTAGYKELLMSNNKRTERVECKIDYSDTEDFIDNNSSSLLTVNKPIKIKTMKHYSDTYSTGVEMVMSNIRCMHCHHEFTNRPYFLPYDYEPTLKRYKVTGNFCSPGCVKTYAMNSQIFKNKIYLLGQMYRSLFSAKYRIKMAPPINTLKCYGGTLNIHQFRANSLDNVEYSLDKINCKIKQIDVIEKKF
jgi:hypothetical protein